jgi:hypothetical protein
MQTRLSLFKTSKQGGFDHFEKAISQENARYVDFPWAKMGKVAYLARSHFSVYAFHSRLFIRLRFPFPNQKIVACIWGYCVMCGALEYADNAHGH